MSRILIIGGCGFLGSNPASAPDNLLRYVISMHELSRT